MQPNLCSQLQPVQRGACSGDESAQHSSNPRQSADLGASPHFLGAAQILTARPWPMVLGCCASPCGYWGGHFVACGCHRWSPGHQVELKPRLSSPNLIASGLFQKLAGSSALLFCGFCPLGVVYTGQAAGDNCCPYSQGARSVAQRGIAQGKAHTDSSKTGSFKTGLLEQTFEEEGTHAVGKEQHEWISEALVHFKSSVGKVTSPGIASAKYCVPSWGR